ncbi:Acg family FMN-binding oxidoreductase [Pseudonocardia acaciae]|uniref:Acg family FMN-binding oxidoreductase n=1 Tax=Pseudonocardia acaciae TaxID=551276 RepID=UPI000560CCBD|nr:hypothetical protein [Pseudonocardia acaciae]
MNSARLDRAIDRDTVRRAIELATRAPSIHNTQPWRWLLGERSVHLYADLKRWLPATDADGRDLLLSCGAALHHLRIALAAAGVGAAVHRLPNPGEPDHLAALELSPGRTRDADLRMASAIAIRRTDRRAYQDWPVPEPYLAELTAAAAAQGATLRVITEDRPRNQVLHAIHEAATAQPATPGYDLELALWSARDASPDGVPAANLPTRPSAAVPAARRFRPGELADRGGAPDRSTLLVLGTASDDRLCQLRAGEALSAVLLLATASGLATCPLSQPLEVGHTRRYLRDQVLGGTLCPQVILRLGWAPSRPALPATPRRRAEGVIEPLSR